MSETEILTKYLRERWWSRETALALFGLACPRINGTAKSLFCWLRDLLRMSVISLVLVDGNLPLIATTSLGQVRRVDLAETSAKVPSPAISTWMVPSSSLKLQACLSFKSPPKLSVKSSSGCPQAILKPSSNRPQAALKSPSIHVKEQVLGDPTAPASWPLTRAAESGIAVIAQTGMPFSYFHNVLRYRDEAAETAAIDVDAEPIEEDSDLVDDDSDA
ncbi:hypothetical protein B0H14DRAFT_3164981 [Mycena olivaceomarginata]|nr:hypothetical protein B0H14DRAFT_3164981 [Mycena olivaceomarginata]